MNKGIVKKAHKRSLDRPWPRVPRYSNFVEALEVILSDKVWVADITYVSLR